MGAVPFVFREESCSRSRVYGLFSLFRYPSRMIPEVVEWFLSRWGVSGGRVFDPFAGYGTVGYVAAQRGMPATLWDINPMTAVAVRAVFDSVPLPTARDVERVMAAIAMCPTEWSPCGSAWLAFWHPSGAHRMLRQMWGYYHHHASVWERAWLALPFVSHTVRYSFKDAPSYKLHRSKRAMETAMARTRRGFFWSDLRHALLKTVDAIGAYRAETPADVAPEVVVGVDAVSGVYPDCAVCLTSPPYFHAREYLRSVKLELLWLGVPEATIRECARLEIPYRTVEPYPVRSATYERVRAEIAHPTTRARYDAYWWALARIADGIRPERAFGLFVGRPTARFVRVPMDTILMEHLTANGEWSVEAYLEDTIQRRATRAPRNPETGRATDGMNREYLLVFVPSRGGVRARAFERLAHDGGVGLVNRVHSGSLERVSE